MRDRQDGPKQRPSGGRPAPRRLFSFDSLRKEKSTTEADETASDVSTPMTHTPLTERPILELPDSLLTDGEGWTEKPLVTSPEAQDEDKEFIPGTKPKKGRSNTKPAPLDLDNPVFSHADNASISSAQLASPSKRRWDTIRHHVLPSISSSVDSSSDSATLPVRPSTPRSYKFGQKKALRQVVETAQTQQEGETKRFAEAIKVACWECRFGEVVQQAKTEREPTLGSSLHLPFTMSTTSLQTPASSAASILSAGTRVYGLKRPPSMHSLVPSPQRSASITRLAAVLTSTMSISRPRELPHEKLVLSTLLVPFFSPLPGTSIENEQATAVETFEYTIRTWKAISPADEVERCIWCCKAASVPSRSRLRLLGTLSSIIFSRDKTFTAETPSVLQTLLQSLFSLAYSLSLSPHGSREYNSVMGYVSAIQKGTCGLLSQPAIEKEYGARYTNNERDDVLREILVTESVIHCLSSGPERERLWAFRTLLKEYWPVNGDAIKSTPLYACAQWRKLNLFLPAVRNLLSTSTVDADTDSEAVIEMLRTRVLPEFSRVREEDAGQIRREVVRLVLELLHNREGEQLEFVLSLLCAWLQNKSDWKADVEATLQEIIADEPWVSILRIIPTLLSRLPDGLQAPTLATILPLIHNRICTDPPNLPSLTLSHFLEEVSRAYPKIFYKPLFSCAAANKDATVVQQMMVLSAISKFMPDLWTRDPDMMSVALTSSVTAPRSNSTGERSSKPRIGQLALTLEVVEQLRLARNAKDLSVTTSVTKFASSLEARLNVIIAAREKNSPFPESQRLLLCSLFKQIRLLTRSLKPANWLSSMIPWVLSWREADKGFVSAQFMEHEIIAAFQQLAAVYREIYTKDSILSPKRKSTTMANIFERQASESVTVVNDADETLKSRLAFLTQASESFRASFLDLIVTVSGMLTVDDYLQLGPVLWEVCLRDVSADILAPACFLLMQVAEKNPEAFVAMVEADFQSTEGSVRRRALEQLGTMFTWRFQLLSQEVILDRNHRRPFKLQRPPVLFVATDIGSSTFIYEGDTDEYKDINGHVIPAELRRRLSEIGWAQEDRVVDHRLQRIRMPMILLPSQLLDKMDADCSDAAMQLEPPSPSASPEPSPSKSPTARSPLVRQESTTGNRPSMKRKPIVVPALLSLFPSIAAMINDSDFVVANAARSIILDFMRDDPTLLSRHVFQLITGNDDDLSQAITVLRLFLHVKHNLPPGMAHHILNHLTGFLKASARHADSPNPLRSYAYALPSVAKLLPQVSKISLRELRRNKVDTFMVPSGSLWFPSTAPSGPMFPRSLQAENNPFDDLPSSLVCMVLVRTSQNLLFLSMLRRNPQDIKVVRKNISGFQLPSLSHVEMEMALSLKDMVPERTSPSTTPHTSADRSVLALSLTLARSHLLLIQQILQCMSRHLNDREELAALIDGLNRILLKHKDDIGIVAHVLMAYMTAATRFKRLFVSGRGYMLFMPAVVKAFVEAEDHPHVRQAIIYSTQRFYALHQESFVFQSFDALGPILSYHVLNNAWIADGVAELFMCLRSGGSPSTPDVAGIHGTNKAQEQEALMVTMAEEVPQTFFASFKRTHSSQDKTAVSLPIVDGYEGKRLKMDDLVKLLLTVIAHNPGIQRAEQFLMFLRALTPRLFGMSRSVQTVLRSGVDALGGILLTRATGRHKNTNALPTQSIEQSDYELILENAPSMHNSAPSSLLRMRLEYLRLVVAFSAAGGQLTPMTMARVVELVKSVLKDSRASAPKVATFLSDFTRASLVREAAPPDVKDVVAYLASLAPLCSAHIHVLDLSEMYLILHDIAINPLYSSDLAFARLIAQYCSTGLNVCETAASQDLIFTFPLRIPLVKLLVDALTMDGANIVEDLEKRPLTHNFLGGIVLPITLALRTSGDIVAESQWAEGGRRDLFSKTWLRLLDLVLTSCKMAVGHPADKSLSLPPSERRKSTDQSTNGTIPSSVKALCLALQIIKVIITRAEADISTASRGIWVQLGNSIKSLLAEGDAMFALGIREYSEPPSPAMSPRTSTFGESQSNLFAFPSSASMHGRTTFNSPRIIDYLAWSMIEWCWLRRSPLMIQMRMFGQERVANLAAELRLQGSTPLASSARTSGRRFSSVFSKPRRSSYNPSAPSSAASTPRNSAYLGSSASFPLMSEPARAPSMLTPSRSADVRQAGYARMPSPISPSGRTSQDSIGLKIVHLGPVDSALGINVAKPTSLTAETIEPGTASAKSLAKEVYITSHFLTRMTYRRIRLVQYLMGYSPALLPMPGSDYVADGMEHETAAWSKNDALRAVVDETKELLDEFREDFGELGDESLVMVDSQPSLASLQE